MKYICQDLRSLGRIVNGRNGGGVCMYLRNNINYQIRDDLCVGQLECVVIAIIRPHSRPFFVSTCYRPPNSAQDVFRHFESLVDMLGSEQKVQKEVDRPTRLLKFVAFVHLPFSFRSLDLFVASLLFRKGTSFCVILRRK